MQYDFVKMFAEEVYEEMKAQGIKKGDIVKESGLSWSAVSRFFNGHTNPPSSSLEAIAGALGMKPVLCLMEVDE